MPGAGDGYYYNFTEMEDVMTRMKNSGDRIDDIIHTIETKVKNMDTADWDGPARDGYNQAQGEWDKACRDMRDAYGTALQGLNKIHNQLGDTESKSEKTWRNLQTY
jgi:WXG100 family type VII secretion target